MVLVAACETCGGAVHSYAYCAKSAVARAKLAEKRLAHAITYLGKPLDPIDKIDVLAEIERIELSETEKS